MHVPDGFLDATTSVATGVTSAAVVTVCLRRAREELDERTAPLAGLVAAYVFAVQMLNFPVGLGTSGHLMGGALAAVLVGPATAVTCLTVVLLVQSLLFADGGLTALGTNVLLIGVVTTVVGWLGTRAALRVLPRRPASVVPASLVGAAASVPVAAMVFVALYAAGGTASLPLPALVTSMLGWHVLIGVGEAVITALTVAAVVAVRPDLVYAVRDRRPALVLRTPDGEVTVPAGGDRSHPGVPSASSPPGTAPSSRSLTPDHTRDDAPGTPSGGVPSSSSPPGTLSGIVPSARSRRGLLAGGAAVTLALAGLVSFAASGSPDGLERAAEDTGFLGTARDHAFGAFALADYGAVGGVPVGVAGVLGVVVTVGLSLVVFRLVSRGDSTLRAARQDGASSSGDAVSRDAVSPRG
jgi:cobalt/nickel transport system permease protein